MMTFRRDVQLFWGIACTCNCHSIENRNKPWIKLSARITNDFINGFLWAQGLPVWSVVGHCIIGVCDSELSRNLFS